MIRRSYLNNGLIGAVAALFGGVMLVRAPEQPGPAMRVVSSVVAGGPATAAATVSPAAATSGSSRVTAALQAFSSVAKSLSSPTALEDGVASYYAYKSAHPTDVKKPYLYFVDYGQPSTAKRGYVL